MRPSAIRRITAFGIAAIAFAGCSGDARLPDAVQVEVETTEAPAVPDPPTCTTAQQDAQLAVTSYEPTEPLPSPGQMPEGSTMAEIQAAGKLVVGVSSDTLQFGARNPITGDIEGFDVDILKEVAIAIFGPDDIDPDKDGVQLPIEFKIITYAQRLPSLENEEVDLVAHTMTINCNRWLRINFSSEYYAAGQKVLVKSDSTARSISDLDAAGARVCVPGASTNLEALVDYPGVEIVEKVDITDCLVAFQQGQADAITGDDTVLVGFEAQDPYAVVVGDAFTEEPYGIGVNKDQVDLTQFVNTVLEEIRTNGRWDEIYRTWVSDDPADLVPPPPAVYGRQPEG